MPSKVKDVEGCQGCPMRQLFPDNSFVPVKHPVGQDLVRLVVGEAPGQDEAVVGEPFVGGAGTWLNKMLASAGIDRSGLTITNVIQCRPPDNIFPTDPEARKYISKEDAEKAVKHCALSHLDPIIRSRRWRRVDLLGDKPLRHVAGLTGGIFKWRGSPVGIGWESLPTIATLHPAYIMRDQTMFPVAVNDLMKSTEIPPEHYNLFPSLEDVREFKAKEFAFDIETEGFTSKIGLVGLCANPYYALSVPFTGPYITELRRIFAEADSVIGHNCLQFDLPILRKSGVYESKGADVWDTMLLQHLCFPDFPHDLGFVGSQFTGKPAWKDDKGNFQLYNARDTDVTLQCFKQLKPMVEKLGLMQLYRDIQVPLAKICRLMHETGFAVDTNRIQYVRETLQKEAKQEESYLPEWLRTHEEACKKRERAPRGAKGKSGKPIKYYLRDTTETVVPWRSPTKKQKYLYGKEEGCLGVDPIYDPKSERITTGKVALDKIYSRTKNRAVRAIRRLNQLDETITTFAKADMVSIDRMYPHFNVHGTSSGRLSSSDPNLQNIPESARCIYVPSHPGWKIVDVDYSQIENRLTAYFAGDKQRLERFARDPKFSEHRYAASLFLGIPYEDVVKDNDKDAPYGKAKRIVHGTNYGMGYKKISNMYDMDLRETRDLQQKWKEAIWLTTQWQRKTGDQAQRDGYLRNPFGRMRWFYTSSYYTEALSFLPQSTAADIIFRAMIGMMYERIGLDVQTAEKVSPVTCRLPDRTNLILQVHDSLVFECANDVVPDLINCVQRVMCQPWAELGGMSIPIGVKIGESWGEAE